MADIITYVKDPTKLVEELQEKFPDLLTEEGDFNVLKTPTVKNADGESLALVRGDNQLLQLGQQLESLVILGTFEEIFNDPEKLAIYDSVYDRTPKTIVDEETGQTNTITYPDHFNVFY
jgi:hypothetical protein